MRIPAFGESWTRARLRFDHAQRKRRALHECFVSQHGLVVSGGPFAGMAYPPQATKWLYNLVPRLLGTYECELHELLLTLIAKPPEMIVDVGSADGYYSTGLALASPRSTVYAFDSNPAMRRFSRKVATLNGVHGRIDQYGECDVASLDKLPGGAATFVKVDCEGCEAGLLDPAVVRLFRRAEIVVELHEPSRGDVPAWIRDRFSASHDIRMIPATARDASANPELADLADADARLLISEGRGETMWWAHLTPVAALAVL